MCGYNGLPGPFSRDTPLEIDVTMTSSCKHGPIQLRCRVKLFLEVKIPSYIIVPYLDASRMAYIIHIHQTGLNQLSQRMSVKYTELDCITLFSVIAMNIIINQ